MISQLGPVFKFGIIFQTAGDLLTKLFDIFDSHFFTEFFVRLNGNPPLNLQNLRTRNLRSILKKAGLATDYNLYSLRHTAATLLIQAGTNPKVVSERLGHASVAFTMDVYVGVLPTMQEAATGHLEAVLFRG